ncbi:MAG TPA: molybdenum cofactor guanylyltransferase MobA [Hyphomicrobiales bacterium]|nr:molybdenum cofactor guanylyltransferase MobA [Hyphomicrobiales bacterium]
MERIAAVVLAGGQGRRMGGADKAFMPLGGRPLIAHVLARLAPQCPVLAISAGGDPARFATFGVPVVADAMAGFPGPLAGILAGLDAAAAAVPPFALVLSVPADAPFLPDDLVARLLTARQAEKAAIAMAASAGRRHPVIALWPVELRAGLRAALAAGERKVEEFAARHRLAVVEWPTAPRDPFLNVNTPADLAAAEAALAS